MHCATTTITLQKLILEARNYMHQIPLSKSPVTRLATCCRNNYSKWTGPPTYFRASAEHGFTWSDCVGVTRLRRDRHARTDPPKVYTGKRGCNLLFVEMTDCPEVGMDSATTAIYGWSASSRNAAFRVMPSVDQCSGFLLFQL